MADTSSTEKAELESGYNDDAPTATPAVVEEVAATAAEPPVVEPIEMPDPLKEVMARFDKFEATQSKLAGHVGGLQRSHQEIQEFLAASKAATKTVDDAPTQAQIKQAMASPQEWEALKAEMPEWAAATEKLLDHRLATQKAPPANEDLEQIKKRMDEERKARVDELNEVHHGWQNDLWIDGRLGDKRTPSYEAWLKTMTPEEVQKFENSQSVMYVDRQLNRFYAWKEAQTLAKPALAKAPAPASISTRQKRLEAAVLPRGTGGHASGGSSEIDEMEAGYKS